MTSHFVKDTGQKLPVNPDFLFAALSPTSAGTNYWEGPPPGPLSERNKGRILLQLHQVLSLFQSYGIDVDGNTFLDVGTGNGLVPTALLALSDLKSAVGSDPFLDGEHQTSWHPHDHNEAFREIQSFIETHCRDRLSFDSYSHLLGNENFTLRPGDVAFTAQPPKDYRFSQIGAHDLEEFGETFDILYCKAIEHIPDWDKCFEQFGQATREGGVVYLKHRPFFSYLGPHRYAATMIPWGHLLMTDTEFRRYVDEFHGERVGQMTKFYFEGLANPRHPVSDMVRIAATHGFAPISVIYEPPRYLDKVLPLIDQVPDFWDILRTNWPGLPTEELFSGMSHILLRRL